MKYTTLAVLLAVLFSIHSASAYVPDYMTLLWNATIKEAMSGLDVGDVNGDGSMEVVVSSSAEGIVYVFGPAGNVLWKFGVPGYVNFVNAVDLDGDGRSEVLTGSSNHLYVINSSGVLLWKFYTKNTNVENAAAFDINGDGVMEILFSASSGGCGDNVLYALNSSSRESLWEYSSGFYYPNVIRFIESEGRPCIIVGMLLAPRGQAGCVPLSYKNSRAVALNVDGELLWIFNTSGGVLDMEAGDVDSDGDSEIVLASMPNLYVINSRGVLEWREDLDDRIDDIALSSEAGGGKNIVAAANGAYIFEPAGGEKGVLDTPDRAYSVASGDINNDGNPEYIVGSDGVYVYDHQLNLLWNSSGLVYVGYLFIANVDNLPDAEVVAGANKQVLVFKTGVRAKLQEADSYYNQARQLYSTGQYSTALNNAMIARDIYYRFEDDNGLDRTKTLMDLINERINATLIIAEEAAAYYDLSLSYYAGEDFINASVNAQTARAKYESVGDKEGAAASEELLNKSRELLLKNASVTALLAFEAYADGDYDLALNQALYAKTAYTFLRNSTEVTRIDALIGEINAARRPTVSERVEGVLDHPLVSRMLHPSEYAAVNLTLWAVYLLALGLILAGIQRLLSMLLQRLSRRTLNLEDMAPKDTDDLSAGKQSKFVLTFFLLVFLAVVAVIIYAMRKA